MTYDIQQSTTQAPLLFLLVQSSDHITGLTGASPTVTISKAGGSFASPSGSVTEIANGWYKCAGNATDTNTLGPLALHATAASGDPCDIVVANIVAYNPQSATNLGLSGVPTANPGAANGIFIAGSNAPVTITGSGDALTITSSGGNGNAVVIAGNGTGDGIKSTGGATGNSLELVGGGTSGDGLKVTTTSGHGFNIAATGTSKHGVTVTGGNGGTSDGMKLVAGTGGVDLRANQTGNLVGTVSTLTTYTGNTVQTGDAYSRLGAPSGASVSADIASIKTDTGTTIPGLIAALNNISSANVKTQVVAALNTDTYAEPAQGTPAATTTIQYKLSFVYKALINKVTQTATELDIYNNAADTVDHKIASMSDDGSTFTRPKIATGP